MRIGAIFCFVSVIYLVGCGSMQRSAGGSGTEITISSVNSEVGRAKFHLSCDPPGGDLPHPVEACAALSKKPELLVHPKPFVCFGGTFSWWDIEIRGRFDGERISTDVSTCWTTQMEMLEVLGMDDQVLKAHMLPRAHKVVLPGTTHVFAPSEIEVADEVTCDIRGHHLAAGVPAYTGGPLTVGYDGLHIVPVTMTVERQDDGSVEVACHTGK